MLVRPGIKNRRTYRTGTFLIHAILIVALCVGAFAAIGADTSGENQSNAFVLDTHDGDTFGQGPSNAFVLDTRNSTVQGWQLYR